MLKQCGVLFFFNYVSIFLPEISAEVENKCVTDGENRLKNKYSNSTLFLLLSMLTAGSSEVIRPRDGRARRTSRGVAMHHLLQPVSFILAPALMKSTYWD